MSSGSRRAGSKRHASKLKHTKSTKSRENEPVKEKVKGKDTLIKEEAMEEGNVGIYVA